MPFEHSLENRNTITWHISVDPFCRSQLHQQPSGAHLCGLHSQRLHQLSQTGIVGKNRAALLDICLHISLYPPKLTLKLNSQCNSIKR